MASEIFPDIDYNDKILNYESIDWNSDFDTIILGHVNELSTIIKFDFLNYFIEKAIMFRKNIFCFFKVDDRYITKMKNEGLKLYFPSVGND